MALKMDHFANPRSSRYSVLESSRSVRTMARVEVNPDLLP
jgi:hypothetical protein